MAEKSGKNGQVQSATADVAGIREWNLSYDADALETTDFTDAGVKTFVAGLTGWTGSFSGFDQAAAPLPAVGATVTLKLELDNTDFYTGSALITNASPAVSVDGVNTIAYTFQGTGTLTVPV